MALKPLLELLEAHVLAAERLHGDDTPVPVLTKGKTDTGRAWVYVRDDKPFAGPRIRRRRCSATRRIVLATIQSSTRKAPGSGDRQMGNNLAPEYRTEGLGM